MSQRREDFLLIALASGQPWRFAYHCCERRPQPHRPTCRQPVADAPQDAGNEPGATGRGARHHLPASAIRLSRTLRSELELEAKGTKFYGGTAPLIATKEPPSSTNQPGHRVLPRVDKST